MLSNFGKKKLTDFKKWIFFDRNQVISSRVNMIHFRKAKDEDFE